MDTKEHAARHLELHRCLDELVADWLTHTERLPSQATVMDLIRWSHKQCTHPDEHPETNISE